MSSRLDAIKARHEIANSQPITDLRVWDSVSDVPALVAVVEAVLELHKEVQWAESWPTCLHCNDGEGSPLAYPCLTVAAIQSALGEGEQ